jgi:hypothetical protein
MTDHDPAALDEREEVIVALLGRYIARRESGVSPQAHDLLAVAAEFGDGAFRGLRAGLTCYEAMRTVDAPPSARRAAATAAERQGFHARNRPLRQPE